MSSQQHRGYYPPSAKVSIHLIIKILPAVVLDLGDTIDILAPQRALAASEGVVAGLVQVMFSSIDSPHMTKMRNIYPIVSLACHTQFESMPDGRCLVRHASSFRCLDGGVRGSFGLNNVATIGYRPGLGLCCDQPVELF